MMRTRHLFRLSGDLVAYAVVNRAWWVIPLMAFLAVAALVMVAGQAAAPFTIYTVF